MVCLDNQVFFKSAVCNLMSSPIILKSSFSTVLTISLTFIGLGFMICFLLKARRLRVRFAARSQRKDLVGVASMDPLLHLNSKKVV